MKKVIYLLIACFATTMLHADDVIIVPQDQYYYYDQYQPFNGPNRGPNSIEGHKSLREQRRQFDQYY